MEDSRPLYFQSYFTEPFGEEGYNQVYLNRMDYGEQNALFTRNDAGDSAKLATFSYKI